MPRVGRSPALPLHALADVTALSAGVASGWSMV
jgi:hypothetical protein